MVNRNLLMIGWDAADGLLVRRLIESGRLPTLAGILNRGQWINVTGFDECSDDAIWTTFSTGLPPSKTGRFHHFMSDPATYELQPFDRSNIRTRPFWADFAKSGRQVLALDVPKSPMANEQGVTEIADWMAHGALSSEVVSWPPDLAAQFWSRPGGALPECHRYDLTEPEQVALHELHHQRRALRTDRIIEMLAANHYDFAIAVYAAPHCAGHHFWHLQEQNAHSDADASILGNPLVQQLEQLDADLATTIAAIGETTDVAVFSPRGMGPATNAKRATEATLDKLDRIWRQEHMQARLASKARRVTSKVTGQPLSDASTRAFWPLERAFGCSAVRLNVRGREPRGIVRRDQVPATLSWLRDRLMELHDGHGNKLLREVVISAERHTGPHAEKYADLVATWAIHEPAEAHTSITTIKGLPRSGDRGGEHRSTGWLVAPSNRSVLDLGLRVDELAGVIRQWMADDVNAASAPAG